jgi:inner membrane protein
VLWRIVAVGGESFHEGFHSLLDDDRSVHFERFDRGARWQPALEGHPPFARMAWFTHGFYKLSREGSSLLVSDLRMGQQPYFTFAFPVAELHGDRPVPTPVNGNAGRRPADIGAALGWIWRRAGGEALPPPR